MAIYGYDKAILPSLTTQERDALTGLVPGVLIYNSSTGYTEQYTSSGWAAISTPPSITTISPSTYNGENGTTITINGSFFDSNAVVKFISASGTSYTAGTTTFVNSGQLTATTPQDFTVAQGPFDVQVVNGSGLGNVLEGALDPGSVPVWQTAAGTIANRWDGYGETALSQNVTATDADAGSSITYSIVSGALPSGITLNSSNGNVSGTLANVSGTTTSNFTVRATDNAGNTADRAFNIIVNPTKDGTTSARAAASALDVIENIRAAGGSASDWQALEGPLWLNPGNAYGTPFQVWCDMTTQGGGWTLAIKWDNAQRTSSVFSLDRNGGRTYSNINALASLDPNGDLYACLDMRDIINYDRFKSYNSTQFGGRYMMHACTDTTSGVGSTHYMGRTDFTSQTACQPGAAINTTVNYSPLFSQFHKQIYDGSQTTYLWDTTASHITNSGSPSTQSTIMDYADATDVDAYGGGVFYGLGTDVRNAPSTHNSYFDEYASIDTNAIGTPPLMNHIRGDVGDGISNFSIAGREGSVYCSGTNNAAPITGHNDPKFNWGWYSADGTQQSYGMGTYTIGTPCSTSIGSTRDPYRRMNYMFVR